jgi:hypothetical protein
MSEHLLITSRKDQRGSRSFEKLVARHQEVHRQQLVFFLRVIETPESATAWCHRMTTCILLLLRR